MSNGLEKFKQDINLTQFAASFGFIRDAGKSTPSACVMRDEGGSKIVITKRDSVWMYFNVDGSSDRGTVIDFIQYRNNVNLGQVRQICNRHLGQAPVAIPSAHWQKSVKQSTQDVAKVRKLFETFLPATHSDYLASRGIPASTLAAPLFQSTVFARGNSIIFPHQDDSGVCGFEVRTPGAKYPLFSKDGKKSLWFGNAPDDCKRLIFAESPIECMSYWQIGGDEALYISAGGSWSQKVSDYIGAIFRRYPDCSIVAAMNNDAGGQRQADMLRDIAGDRDFSSHYPTQQGGDWNAELNAGK